MNYLLVFIGGGLGSIFRFGIAQWLNTSSHAFPIATLIANFLSCILLGALVQLQLKSSLPPGYAVLLMTGFCGGFSTFSTFTNETYQLLAAGMVNYAMLNIAASLLCCLLGIYIGLRFF